MTAPAKHDNSSVPHALTRERLITTVADFSLVLSLIYVGWRGLFTLGGVEMPAAIVLFGAEVLGVFVFAARVRSARAEPLTVVVSPDAPVPDTTAVVEATGADVGELRTTLVALRRVAGLERIVVVDRDGSRWLRTIASRFNAVVTEPSVSFNEAVTGTGTSWVLVLRSGDLPMPDLVSVCAPRCSSPEIAVVQVGVEEADPTSFDHDPDGYWSLEPFEQEVVRPSLAARGSVPWYGDGPAMVRRSAVVSIAGSGPGHLLEKSRGIGLDFTRSGLAVTQLPATLARVRGPYGLGESLLRRHRRTRSALRVVATGQLRGVGSAARVAHLLALTPWLAAVQRMLLVGAAILVLGFGQVPVDSDPLPLLVLAGSSYGLRWRSHSLLGRGRLEAFSILRSDLRSLLVDLLPFGRVRPGVGRAGLVSVVLVVALLNAVVVIVTVAMWRDWPGRLPIGVAAVALALAAGFLGVALEVLLDAVARHQRRTNHRVRLGLVTCRLEEHDGQLVDLSTGGAGVVVATAPEETPRVGDVTTLAFRIPDADGAWRGVSTLVHVAHVSQDPDGATRLGLSFDDPTDAPLDPVIEFLTIDRRLVALGRHETVSPRG